MTFFGSILLEEKLVTTQQLVEALVTQSEELASPIRICLDQKLVTPDRLDDAVLEAAEQHATLPEILHRMKLVDSQKAEQKISFEDSCKALGLWTDSIES